MTLTKTATSATMDMGTLSIMWTTPADPFGGRPADDVSMLGGINERQDNKLRTDASMNVVTGARERPRSAATRLPVWTRAGSSRLSTAAFPPCPVPKQS